MLDDAMRRLRVRCIERGMVALMLALGIWLGSG
jgi:hypothetical protein